MEIHISTKKGCEIQNNRGFLPTLEEINLIIENLNEMREQVIKTDVEKYNAAISQELQKGNLRVNNAAKIKKVPKKIKGYIYLIKVGKFYKIGRTQNLKGRFTKYVTENPNRPELIHYYKHNDCINEEYILHETFSHKNHNREWFKLDKNDILFIKNLKNEI